MAKLLSMVIESVQQTPSTIRQLNERLGFGTDLIVAKSLKAGTLVGVYDIQALIRQFVIEKINWLTQSVGSSETNALSMFVQLSGDKQALLRDHLTAYRTSEATLSLKHHRKFLFLTVPSRVKEMRSLLPELFAETGESACVMQPVHLCRTPCVWQGPIPAQIRSENERVTCDALAVALRENILPALSCRPQTSLKFEVARGVRLRFYQAPGSAEVLSLWAANHLRLVQEAGRLATIASGEDWLSMVRTLLEHGELVDNRNPRQLTT